MTRVIILFKIFVFLFVFVVFSQNILTAQTIESSKKVSTDELKKEIGDFTAREIAAHFADIKTLNPPPDRVFNALTVGEFSWGSFARALAAQADIGGNQTIAGKDTARAIAEIGLIEARNGGKAFSQLYSTLALRHYGTDLSKNAVWQSMTEAERKEWYALLDPSRFYDAKKRQVINLPENYLGVAARVAAMSWQMGVWKDRALLDSVVERAAEQFLEGKLYSDDNPPTGRYDRYSNEYARFCWDAAEIAGRKDILEKLKPTLKEQMKVWWDLVSPAGYGYNWGRSQGLVSYLDTLEITAFLGQHAEFRPTNLENLAAIFNQAWRWIRADYSDQTHMFTVFKYGRGNYSYINPQREWQQAGTSFGKIILANYNFMNALEKENLKEFPAAPKLNDVARLEFFEKKTDRQYGVWLVRQGKFQFALPFTTGTKPAIADYLPAPFGLLGFSAPVEEVYPSFVPFLELSDGKTYAASEGASKIIPANDGKSVKAIWRKWAQIGSKSGEIFANGLTSEVEFKIENNKLIRRETLTAENDINIKKWHVAVPTTAEKTWFEIKNEQRTDYFSGREGTLAVSVKSDWKLNQSILATGDSRLGKGVLGAIPLHSIYESQNISIKKGQKMVWEITLELKN
ncbi:MAG TPA: hypothetical protein PKY59_09805 [Pyrinomonadaceae bacterium]|nr:hypothetical protein [Pyrinomonadaceae bacterium]